MIRAALTAAAAFVLLGAAKVPTVDYRLGVEAPADGQPPRVDVELTFRGDADGETRLQLPDHWASAKDLWRYVSDVRVQGAAATEDGPAVRVLRHKPGAKITVRYRVRTAYDADPAGIDGNPYKGALIRPGWMSLMGNFVFASPEGREDQPATFRWGRLPGGWRVASDLEHGRMGRPLRVDDVGESITVGAPHLAVIERPITGGTLRFAAPAGAPFDQTAFADDMAKVVSAQRAFWNDLNEPYFVAYLPLTPKPSGSSSGGTGRGDGFVLYGTPNTPVERIRWTLAHEHVHTWIPMRIGRRMDDPEARYYWLSEGFTEFYTARTLLRAGLVTPEQGVGYWAEGMARYEANPLRTAPVARIISDFWTDPNAQRLPYQRGMLLALKWDDEIRRKTGGKADLDDVMLRMRDHNAQFPAGQGPDLITGVVSAAWVVAQIGVRPDIAKYAEGGAYVDLPEQLFDGCLDARIVTSPAFDAGFDYMASAKDMVAKGVRQGGPAWNAGLRDGAKITKITLTPDDTSREVAMTVLPNMGQGKPLQIRYWPYGDKDVSRRRLQLAVGLSEAEKAACARKAGGL